MKLPRVRTLLLIGGLFLGWFVFVQWVIYLDDCPHCLSRYFVRETRVMGVRLHSATFPFQVSPIEETAITLGVPCDHHGSKRRMGWRYWGLVYCSCPCHQGTLGLSGGKTAFDNAQFQSRVLERYQRAPEIAEEFQRRVLVDHDFEYWKQLFREISDVE